SRAGGPCLRCRRRRPPRRPAARLARKCCAGVLRTVIALPVAVAPPYVPLHLWVLERPDGKTEPDLLALFVEAAPEVRTGWDYATSSAAGTMPTASWRDFTHSIEIAGDSPRNPGKRRVCSGGTAAPDQGTPNFSAPAMSSSPQPLRRAPRPRSWAGT